MNPILFRTFPPSLRRSPRSHLPLLLAPIALLVLAVGCGGASDAANSNGAPDANAAPAVVSDFRVRSELVFNTRADLPFEVPGEVGAVNIVVGDTVSAGDTLATLDTETLSELERAAAQAEFDLDAARDQLDAALGLESDDPLVRARAESGLAQAESVLAQAEVNLDNAQERLDDFQLQYNVSLGDARRAVAVATADLDRAEEALSDFAAEYSERFAQALEVRERAKVTLDAAEETRDDFLPNYDEALTGLRNRISTTEQNLDQARDALRDFNTSHDDRLASARLALAQAEADLDTAEEAFAAFQLRAIEGDFRALTGGENFDVVQFNALQSAVSAAERAVETWTDEVADLETGPKEFDRDAAANRVLVLEDRLARLNRDLSDESAGPDQNRLALLQAAVNTARERLNRADRDLAEVAEGVDQLELARLQAISESGRLALDSAQNRLARLEKGPDQAEQGALTQGVATARQAVVTARESRDDLAAGPDAAAVALARSNIDRVSVIYDTAQEDLESAVLRAPIDGIVRLVTASAGDIVTVDARVIQIVDPTDVSVLGLVETNYIERLNAGTPASVTLSALPGVTFEARVSEVSGEARTERGVISFPVVFSVTIPPDVAIPPNPGLVTTTVTP